MAACYREAIYHDSLEEEIPFGCVSEMAICLEKLF